MKMKPYKPHRFSFVLGVQITVGPVLIFLSAIITELNWLSVLFATLGSALVTMFFVSVVHDTKSLGDYFSDRITDVIVKDEYIEKLDSEELKRLRSSIQSTLRKESGNNKATPVMNALYEELDILMKQCWITKREFIVTIKKNNDGYFDKTVRIITTYQNWKDTPHQEPCIRWVNMKKIDNIDTKEHFKINEFTVNNKIKFIGNDDLKIDTIPKSNGAYDIVVTCDKYFEVDNTATVICETSRKITSQDKDHVIHIGLPCEEFKATFIYIGDSPIKMYAYGFCNNRSDKLIRQHILKDNAYEIVMGPGLMPGSGIVMFYELD